MAAKKLTKISSIFLLYLASILNSSSSTVLAIECKKAKSPVEKTICASPELLGNNDILNDVFKKRKETLDRAETAKLLADQKAWLNHRDQCPASDEACILKSVKDRIGALRDIPLDKSQLKKIRAQKESHPQLEKYFQSEKQIRPSLPKFTWYKVDLDDDDKEELLVHLHSKTSCGNGGCNFYIFKINRGSPKLKLITQFSISNDPIFILDSKTHGWHDIAISTGGLLAPAVMKFNKIKYPGNPSLEKPLKGKYTGLELEPVKWE